MANYYRYSTKGSSGDRIQGVSSTSYSSADFGAFLSQSLPLTSSIKVHFYPDSSIASSSQYTITDTTRIRVKSLKNILSKYRIFSPYYEYSSSLMNYEANDLTIVNIPSIFYGDSIKKGSVKLSVYSDGILNSRVEDTGRNGELIRTSGSVTLTNSKEVAGVVMYDEGFVLLFDRTPLTNYTESFYKNGISSTNGDYARWSNWGISANTTVNSVVRTSYDIEFDGINKIPQLTMLANAPKGQYNHSNNYTFITYNTASQFKTGSTFFVENDSIQIKNIVKSAYSSPTASFSKETYISKILIYDENKNVIAVAKTSKPIRKTETRDYTFKMKLDL